MANYRWSDVVSEHERLYRRLLGIAAEDLVMPAARSASSTGD
jgi:hypothetical protein